MARAQALPVYSIGNPTDEEQLWLSMLNYERANPQAEAKSLENATDPEVLAAYSYFSVDLAAMVSAFDAIPPEPPLSFNADLMSSSFGHSQDMYTNTYQGHIGSDGSTAEQRVAAAGYEAQAVGENVFAFATSVYEGNASFEVDWGDGPDGIQSPASHRANDHDSLYSDIGIGIVDGTVIAGGTTFGPLLCTMDFGVQATPAFYVTGVVYYDLSGSGTYETGEGLGGVAVNVTGAGYSGLTANSGGYSVPVSGSGVQTVTFSVNGLPAQQVTATLTGSGSVEVDLPLTYTPPVVTGTADPPLGQDSTYQFTPVPGATAYQFKQARLVAFTTIETGAGGAGDFTASITGDYPLIATDEPFDGNSSFHLEHVTTAEQSLQLDKTLIPGAKSALQFEKLLGYASSTEIAVAEVSTDGGGTWHGLWSEAGSNGRGDGAFVAESISLAKYAGQEILIRFIFDSDGEYYYNEVATGVGLYLDNITVTGAKALTKTVISNVTSPDTFVFDPAISGTFALAVRAQALSRYFPWGPDAIVEAGGSGDVTAIPFNAFKGKYAGAIGNNGLMAMTLSANGAISTTIKLNGKTTQLAGKLDAQGAYSKTLKSGLVIELQLTEQPSPLFTGVITSGSVATDITLDPVENALSAQAFTWRVPALSGSGLPQGAGYGTMSMKAGSAAATFSGKLGDGTAVTFSSNAIVSGTSTLIPIYLPLYKSKGSISGTLTREETANGDLDGTLQWTKATTTGTFSTPVHLYGSFYVKPLPGERVIDLTSGTFAFAGGGLSDSPSNNITLTSANKVVVTGTNTDHLKVTVNPKNGLFSGSFVPPGAHAAAPISGAFFQGSFNFGAGLFKGPGGTGSVSLQ
jgi:hypothetical protein